MHNNLVFWTSESRYRLFSRTYSGVATESVAKEKKASSSLPMLMYSYIFCSGENMSHHESLIYQISQLDNLVTTQLGLMASATNALRRAVAVRRKAIDLALALQAKG